MRLYKTLGLKGLYKASNVTFDPLALDARSYGYWRFVRRYGKHLVFNRHRYSQSTSRHQSKVLGLMHDLGLEVTLFVDIHEGLQNLDTLGDVKRLHEEGVYYRAAEAETKRLERNRKARERRQLKRAVRGSSTQPEVIGTVEIETSPEMRAVLRLVQ